MSYTYMAITSVGEPVAAFPRKHELERWCKLEENKLGPWCRLFRILSKSWQVESNIVELRFDGTRLIDKL